MKYIKLYKTKEEALGKVLETPAIVMADTKTVFAPQTLGDKIEVSQDENGELIVSIHEDDLDTTEYIDLGLPSDLKWASCNLGAKKPCDYGLYYQWGRTDGYAYDDPNIVNHYLETKDESDSTKQYDFTMSGHEYRNNGEVLLPEDDAVYVATNGKAHMPTVDDIDELLTNTFKPWCQCTVLGEDHASHTVYGTLFKSKTNSNKIFIPAAGSFYGSGGLFLDSGSRCHVWSASCSSSDNAYFFGFNSGDCGRNRSNRANGYSVRGVKK